LVGLNAYQSQAEEKIPVFKGNPETEQRQVEQVQALRRQRDNTQVKQSLANLVAAARANENLLPALIESVKAYATIGEICEALRGVYGTYKPSQVI
jgi:methylmalonyl-CoA mutase N-terminal domain/subunit